MQNQVKEGREGVTWLTFDILEPLYISGTVEARKFKFGTPKQNANSRDEQ